MTQFIKATQQINALSLTTAASTATITAVTLANTIIMPQGGRNTGGGSIWYTANGRWSFLSTTQAELRRDAAATAQFNGYATVVEFNSDVISIQSGVITITAGATSANATITAVGANAFVILEGAETTAGSGGYSDVFGNTVELASSTQVTARIGLALGSDIKVGWMVVELSSNIIQSVEQYTKTDATAATTYNAALTTTVDWTRSIVIPNGVTCAVTSTAIDRYGHTHALTSPGNVAVLTRAAATTSSRTVRGTVVQFKAAALNGAIQRGTIAGNGSTAAVNSSALTAVTLNMSWANYCGISSSGGTAGSNETGITMNSTTTVQLNTGLTSNAALTVAFEVVQFDNTAVGGGSGKPWHYYNRMRDAA